MLDALLACNRVDVLPQNALHGLSCIALPRVHDEVLEGHNLTRELGHVQLPLATRLVHLCVLVEELLPHEFERGDVVRHGDERAGIVGQGRDVVPATHDCTPMRFGARATAVDDWSRARRSHIGGDAGDVGVAAEAGGQNKVGENTCLGDAACRDLRGRRVHAHRQRLPKRLCAVHVHECRHELVEAHQGELVGGSERLGRGAGGGARGTADDLYHTVAPGVRAHARKGQHQRGVHRYVCDLLHDGVADDEVRGCLCGDVDADPTGVHDARDAAGMRHLNDPEVTHRRRRHEAQRDITVLGTGRGQRHDVRWQLPGAGTRGHPLRVTRDGGHRTPGVGWCRHLATGL
eukprot:PhM_4_TR1725/c0_g1_i1/m.30579